MASLPAARARARTKRTPALAAAAAVLLAGLAYVPSSSASPVGSSPLPGSSAAQRATAPSSTTAADNLAPCFYENAERDSAASIVQRLSAQEKKLRKVIKRAEAKSKLSKKARLKLKRDRLKLKKIVAKRKAAQARVSDLTASAKACAADSPVSEGVGEVMHGRLNVAAPASAPVTVSQVAPTKISLEAYQRWLDRGMVMGTPFSVNADTAGRVTLRKVYAAPLPPATAASFFWYDAANQTWRRMPADISADRRSISLTVSADALSTRLARRSLDAAPRAIITGIPITDGLLHFVGSAVESGQNAWEDAVTAVGGVADQVDSWTNDAYDSFYNGSRRVVDWLGYQSGNILGLRADRPACGTEAEMVEEGTWPIPGWADVALPPFSDERNLPVLFCAGSSGDELLIKAVNNRGYPLRFDVAYEGGRDVPGARISTDFASEEQLQILGDVAIALRDNPDDAAADALSLAESLTQELALAGVTSTFQVDSGTVQSFQDSGAPMVRFQFADPYVVALSGIYDVIAGTAPSTTALTSVGAVLLTCFRGAEEEMRSADYDDIAARLVACASEYDTVKGIYDDIMKQFFPTDSETDRGRLAAARGVSSEVASKGFLLLEVSGYLLVYREAIQDFFVNYPEETWWTADVTSTLSCAPEIDSISAWEPGKFQTRAPVEIVGRCFGPTPADENGALSSYFRVVNKSTERTFNACYTEPVRQAPDLVGCRAAWAPTGNKIIFYGFDDGYDTGAQGGGPQQQWRVENGDPLVVTVWNSRGPGEITPGTPSYSCRVIVGTGKPTDCRSQEQPVG